MMAIAMLWASAIAANAAATENEGPAGNGSVNRTEERL